MFKTTKQLILASSSPRRKQILEGLNIPFSILEIKFDETYPQELSPEEIPVFISQQKAKQLPKIGKNEVYLTSDTVVILAGKVIEKPTDKLAAAAMLKSLSGKTHYVITGVCLTTSEEKISFKEVTEVTFHLLDEEEINYYINNYSPLDKAGAYGIQEWIGLIGIKEINGNYDNVVGLPASTLFQKMKQLNLFE